MAMSRDEFVELMKDIAATGGDTDDMLDKLKRVQDDFDEREGMLKELGEGRDRFSDDDVMDKDGVKWSVKYDDMRRRYRDRFFTSGEEVKESQNEDIAEDTERPDLSYEALFEGREGNYE